jgi:hypothetical protein
MDVSKKVFTTSRHWFLNWELYIYSAHRHIPILRLFSILLTTLILDVQSGSHIAEFATNILYVLVTFSMPRPFHSPLTWFT